MVIFRAKMIILDQFFDRGMVKVDSVGSFGTLMGLKCVGIRQSWDFVRFQRKNAKNGQNWDILHGRTTSKKRVQAYYKYFSGGSGGYLLFLEVK